VLELPFSPFRGEAATLGTVLQTQTLNSTGNEKRIPINSHTDTVSHRGVPLSQFMSIYFIPGEKTDSGKGKLKFIAN